MIIYNMEPVAHGPLSVIYVKLTTILSLTKSTVEDSEDREATLHSDARLTVSLSAAGRVPGMTRGGGRGFPPATTQLPGQGKATKAFRK